MKTLAIFTLIISLALTAACGNSFDSSSPQSQPLAAAAPAQREQAQPSGEQPAAPAPAAPAAAPAPAAPAAAPALPRPAGPTISTDSIQKSVPAAPQQPTQPQSQVPTLPPSTAPAIRVPTTAPAAVTAAPSMAAQAKGESSSTVPSGGGVIVPQLRHLPSSPGATTFKEYPRSPTVATADDAISTFSLDTDRTSFQLALNWVIAGYDIDPASVRAEEWTNAFNYDYDLPSRDDSFGIHTDIITHPLDSNMLLARIAFQAPEISTDQGLNVTLVLDASGSMADGNRIDIARAAARSIQNSMGEGDRISVVHFTDYVLEEYTLEDEAPSSDEVSLSINNLQPHGSTNVQAGLNLGVMFADRMRDRYPDRHNYVILFSDGVANVDATNPFSILDSASAYDPTNPIRLITIGVGIANYNDFLLEQLAQHGNGWYRYFDSPEQAAATFTRENWLALSTPFADQTRAQITWNPKAVYSWRLVGYENRVTADENFQQARKEFAEIPSGAATTVFYELHPSPDLYFGDEGQIGDIEVRWVTPVSGDNNRQHARIERRINNRPNAMLNFSAIVALSADRYSAINSTERGDYAEDINYLRGQLVNLRDTLGHLTSYQDFELVLTHLAHDAPTFGPRSGSGYSR